MRFADDDTLISGSSSAEPILRAGPDGEGCPVQMHASARTGLAMLIAVLGWLLGGSAMAAVAMGQAMAAAAGLLVGLLGMALLLWVVGEMGGVRIDRARERGERERERAERRWERAMRAHAARSSRARLAHSYQQLESDGGPLVRRACV